MKKDEQNTKRRPEFSNKSLNFTIDLLAFVLMFSMIGTGLVIRYILPPGSGSRSGGYGLLLWGMDRHEWGGLHFWISVGLVLALALHVALHWSWVCNFVRRRFVRDKPLGKLSQRSAIALGVGFIVLLNAAIVWFLWASNSNVFVATEPEHDRGEEMEIQGSHARGVRVSRKTADSRGNGGRRTGVRSKVVESSTVRGSMTLKEVSKKTGVPIDTIKTSLDLPQGVSVNERLGQLKRRYRFQIEDVRKIVADYHKF
ncbi:MAG: DUF4405 domain-containing protein [Proteobacteria bacterium]|nr:DUF4405 domain-containing protein [Pseudomonadota bacterium]